MAVSAAQWAASLVKVVGLGRGRREGAGEGGEGDEGGVGDAKGAARGRDGRKGRGGKRERREDEAKIEKER